jgi:hypothetical protein
MDRQAIENKKVIDVNGFGPLRDGGNQPAS